MAQPLKSAGIVKVPNVGETSSSQGMASGETITTNDKEPTAPNPEGKPPAPGEPLTRLRTERTQVRRRATLAKTTLTAWRDAATPDADELAWAIEEATESLNELVTISRRLPDEPSNHERELSKAIFIAKRQLDRLESRTENLSSTLRLGRDETSQIVVQQPDFQPMLAPPVIPNFDGVSTVSWGHFWGLFDAHYGSRPYPPAEKLSQLVSRMKGAAADAVAGFEINGDNYDEVVSLLKRRFDRPDARRELLLRRLNSLPVISNSASPAERRKCVDALIAIVRELKALGSSVGESAVPIAVSKLPSDWRTRWIRNRRRQSGETTTHSNKSNATYTKLCEPDFEELVAFLEEEMCVMEDSASLSSTTASKPQKPSQNYKQPTNQKPFKYDATVSALPATTVTNNQQPNQTTTCPACRGAVHSLRNCQGFLNTPVSGRIEIVKQARICENCLGPHAPNRCRSHYVCRYCRQRHHSLLCMNPTPPPSTYQHQPPHANNQYQPPTAATSYRQPTPSNQHHLPTTTTPYRQPSSTTPYRPATSQPTSMGGPPSQPVRPAAPTTVLAASTEASEIYGMSAACYAFAPEGYSTKVRVLFDSGADTSFIRTAVVDYLNLPILGGATFACLGVMGKTQAARYYPRVAITLANLQGYYLNPTELWVTDTICAPMKPRKPPPPFTLPEGGYLADDLTGGPVDILIGLDLINKFKGYEEHDVTPSLRTVETRLGWVLRGKGEGYYIPEPTQHMAHVTTIAMNRISIEVNHLWELEGVGIQPEPEVASVQPEPRWAEDERRVLVPLLWKNEERPVPNYHATHTRVNRMLTSLSGDRRKQYDDFIDMKLAANIIKPSPESWRNLTHQFFLAHRAGTGEKFKAFFDASAPDGSGRPLNSYLVAGPNLLPKVHCVLLRFRICKIGLQADIEAAFHQIALPEHDKPFVQFTYGPQIYSFNRAVFGLICSPAMFHAAVDFLLANSDQESTVDTLRQGLYFDDLACGYDTVAEACHHAEIAVQIFRDAGMNLHKIRKTGDDLPPSKLLGLIWDTKNDQLSIPLRSTTTPMTRKALLSYVSSLWDPLGLLTPWSIRGKIYFQKTWPLKIGWDEPLPEEILRDLSTWITEATSLKEIPAPRICLTEPTGIECYVDASQTACCCALYLTDSEDRRQLLISKSRLAPIGKPQTIPRLELVAAVLGVRLTTFVREALGDIPLTVRYFSDSKNVLYWLQRRKPTKIFVANRVKEVLQKSNLDQWAYIETDRNPADLGTRGVHLNTLASSTLWWNGPEPPADHVPFCELEPPESAVEEEKRMLPAAIQPIPEPQRNRALLLDIERVQRLSQVIQRTAWIYRFINRCKARTQLRNQTADLPPLSVRRNGKLRPGDSFLSTEELEKAMHFWLRLEQAEYFDLEEIAAGRPPKNLWALRPTIRQGIVYCEPRTGEMDLPLLPRESRFTRLIVEDAHRKAFHGVSITISLVQAKYHLPRAYIKSVINACRRCRRFRGKHYQGPEGPLPNTRIEFTRCFARIGIDYFGPILVNNAKRYCLLSTCYSSRAIHLEATRSQSTEDTLFALRKFFALRGMPMEIMSDNAKTFLKVSKAIPQGIRWKTIPEYSPWWGGFYERLVGTVKSCLRIPLRHRELSYREFQICLYELSYYINLRPLLKTGEEILCPSAILYGVPGPSHILNPAIAESPEEHWRLRRFATERLKSRFMKEYMIALRSWRSKRRELRYPSPGDVVLVHDRGPRARWKMALVESLITGADGNCRAAFIRIGGETKRRALELLYLLEGAPVKSTFVGTGGGTDAVGDLRGGTAADTTVVERSTDAEDDADVRELPDDLPDDRIEPADRLGGSDLTYGTGDRSHHVETRTGRRVRLPTRYLD